MNEIPLDSTARAPRKLWVRALLMLLFAMAFQLAAWLLVCVAVVQLVISVATEGPNPRLGALGAGIGRYLAQIADFVTFRSEALPFPLSDWPALP